MDNIAGELDLPFRAIDSILFGYFRLRAILKEAGWGQVAASLGDLIRREDLDLSSYEVTATDPADNYVVRSLGISVGDRPVRRAVVEPFSDAQLNDVRPTRRMIGIDFGTTNSCAAFDDPFGAVRNRIGPPGQHSAPTTQSSPPPCSTRSARLRSSASRPRSVPTSATPAPFLDSFKPLMDYLKVARAPPHRCR